MHVLLQVFLFSPGKCWLGSFS